MMDPTMARLRENVAQRGDEILHMRSPGFEPKNNDVRSAAHVEPSDNPLSVVAPRDARFVVLDRDGRQAYSRDGEFSLREGRLVLGQGQPVMGFSPGSALLSELRVTRSDELLGRVQHLHVERDGALVYERNSVDPRNGMARRERVLIGTVALARFPAGAELQHAGFLERAPLGIQPHVGRPRDGSFEDLRLGQHELGSLDLNSALARLHDAYQQLDAVAAAQRAARETAKTAMDLVK